MENEGMLPLRQLVEAVTAEAIWRQEERLRALEARVDSLEEAIQRALETVFPRVDALVSQLEKRDSCPTRGCPTSTDSGLSDQLAQVSISAVHSEVHTGSVPVQSASCRSSSCPQSTYPPAFDSRSSPFPTCASTCPPVLSTTSPFACDGHPSRRSSSPTVEVSHDTPPSPSGAIFAFAPCTSVGVAFPTASVSNSGFPSLPQNPASTISTTAVATSTRFSFSSTASPSVSQPSYISSFNPIVCSARSPLYSRVASSDQPVHSASFVTTTTASLPCNTSTSLVSPLRDHFSGGFTLSTNVSSTFTTVSLPSVTSSCVASNQFSSIGSGGSYQLTSVLDVPSAGSFQTADQVISPSNVVHIPPSSSFTTSTQQAITTSHYNNSTRISTGTRFASSRNAMAAFASTPSSYLPSAAPTYANPSPSDMIARSYSTAFVGRFPSNSASSAPSVFSVPNVFGLSCVPSAWR